MDDRTLQKIKKFEEKGKSANVIKFLNSKDLDVVRAAMDSLGNIRDEDSVNTVAHMIDNDKPEIRCAAAACLGKIGTEYCKTYLMHRAGKETDASVKEAISAALRELAANRTRR